MPRPNPPRKRPRRRPDAAQRAARADAELTKQTAQSTQGSQPKPLAKERSLTPERAAPAPAPAGDELWSRRSYAILLAIIAVLQLPVSAIQWAVQPPSSRGPLQFVLLGLNPISLVIAALFAVPIARLITREPRTLRFLETITIGIVTYFLWLVLAFPAGYAIASSPTSTGTSPTPCPSSAASCTTPSPAPTATPAATPSASSGASPSASATTTPTVIDATGQNYTVFAVVNLAAFVLTVYVYPPLYRRLRVRRPPPGSGRAPGGRGRPAKPATKKDATP